MISVPTVLILGAGASAHVGYPLGGALVAELSRLRAMRRPQDLPARWTAGDVGSFLTRMSRAGHSSIDAFLESVPEHADLGKYLIASELKRHEDIDLLFPPNDSGWYQYLFNRLLCGGAKKGFSGSRLSVITFNYDRSLEAYLHEALKARFDMSDTDAHAVLTELDVVHVHGILGQYRDVPYSAKCTPDELINISEQIKIIHEVKDRSSGFCTPEFQRAHGLLQAAERVIFLGFGFHPDNMRRLSFFTPENANGREFYATTAGMGSVEVRELGTRLEPLGVPRSALNGHVCNAFFKEFVSLR